MVKRRSFLGIFFLLGFMPGLIGALCGQTFTGSVTGVVTDPQGAVLPAAAVVATNTATGEVRRAETDEEGRYRFSQLLPGVYTLKVSAAGFKEYLRTEMTVGTNETLEVNAQLELGQPNETVEVTGAPPLLDTQTPTQATTLDSRMMEELPVSVRNPFVLVHATAGVVAVRTGVSDSLGDQDHARIAVNGGRDETVLILIDGVPSTATDWGGLIAAPGVDSVRELQVIRNTYDAQFGRSGGGVVNLSTKGGSQKGIHGTLFEYLRNDNLDANSFFNNRNNRPLPEFKRNQFGFNVGAPIWRSKRLSGFFGYEGLRQGTPASINTTVPTALERAGDFSQSFNANGSLAVIYDPLTTRPDPARPGRFIRDPFPGNRIPANRLDPIGVNVVKLFPLPNQPGNAFTRINNFFQTGTTVADIDRYDARVDWARSDNHSLYARFTRSTQNGDPPRFFGNPAAETNADSGNQRYQIAIGNTFFFSPKFIANIQIGGGSWTEFDLSRGRNSDPTALGFSPDLVRQFYAPISPEFSIGNYSSLGNRDAIYNRRHVINFQANFTREMAAHSLKFGANYEMSQHSRLSGTAPLFSFDRFFTGGPDPDARLATAGNSIASLLLGTGASGSLPVPVDPFREQPYWAFFVQDTWNVNRRLTLNYGLRYELQQARTERHNRVNYFDYDAVNPVGQQAGLPNLKGGLRFVDADNPSPWDVPKNNFAPRFGFAYKLTDKLVARGGFGIFYLKTTAARNATAATQGFSVSTPWVTSIDGGRTPQDYLRNPFPSGTVQATGASLGLLTQVGLGVETYQRENPTPYMQQYSLDLQYQIGNTMVVELGYVGNQGRKLNFGYNFERNQLPDSALALGPALLDPVPNPFFGIIKIGTLAGRTVQRGQLLRPFPQFTSVQILDVKGSSSSYNGFVAKLTRRFSEGLTLTASYQFSKAIDNASEDQGWEIGDRARNFNNLALERSISGHDVPHDVAVNFIYELPVGKKRRFGNDLPAAVNAVVGGWQVSGIFKRSSGLPLMFSAVNNTSSFGGSQFPNVSDIKAARLDEPTIDRWFNTSVFSQPAQFTFGNAPRFFSNLRADGVNNWDISLSKNFHFLERMRAQFRAEFFNAFNRTQFSAPNTSIAAQNFGQVTAQRNRARNIQLALRINF
jgi:hypothetical protein